ncbi:hypothetical protein ACFX15_017395 [Malus domestica]
MKVKIEGTLWISCWKFKSIATLVVLPLIEIASIKGTILDMFAGGTDTTYTVPEWAMTRFLRHPRVLKKLQNEIAGIANGKQDIAETRAMVFINAWTIARDPALWEYPEEFKPERFVNSAADFKGHDFELLPFGAGEEGLPWNLVCHGNY